MRAGFRGVTTNAFVQEVWFEGVPLRDVWYEGVKLYPDERTVVRDVVLELPVDHYWTHVKDAALKGFATVVMTLGGRDYHLFRGDGSLPVLVWVDGAFRADGADRLLLADCLDATVTVSAEVQQRDGEMKRIVGYEVFYCAEFPELPLIAGTQVGMSLTNFSRKRSLYSMFGKVKSLPSGVSWDAGNGTNENNSRPRTAADLISDDEVKADDYGFSVEVATSGGAYYDPMKMQFQYVYPVWPAFSRSWSMKVLGVTLQRKK